MGEESGPAGDLSAARVAGPRVVGRDDPACRGRQAAAVVLVAPAETTGGVPVVVLHQDLPQGLDLRACRAGTGGRG